MADLAPALIAEQASTPEEARQAAGLLTEMLCDPDMPEAMRADLRRRLVSLQRSWPETD